ncbi:hypothetical protein BD413DRAFT_556246 [Trametes elegans]|nr:hypothetical protein BD413DRAFT_556246 [Trametes elegans]
MTGAASSPLCNFQFSTIGHEPALLKRLSAPDPALQDTTPSPSPSPLSSPKPPTSVKVLPTSRKTLLEALGGIEESAAGTIDANNTDIPLPMAQGASSEQGPSGSAAQSAPQGAGPFSAVNENPPVSTAAFAKMNGTPNGMSTSPSESSFPFPASSGPAPARPALNTLFPVPSLSLSAINPIAQTHAEHGLLQPDDALELFRHALQRLHAESEEYARREEETRHAMARQQDQSARWHARADALLESLTALFAHCEYQVASASYAVAEVERLRGVVRRHEEDAADVRNTLATLEARNAELARALEDERLRMDESRRHSDARMEELRQTAQQASAEKDRLERVILDANALEQRQAAAAAELERKLLAQLEQQQRAATQEQQELLGQLEEQKRLVELEKERRMNGIVEEQRRLEHKLKVALAERGQAPHGRASQDGASASPTSPGSRTDTRTSPTQGSLSQSCVVSRSGVRFPLASPEGPSSSTQGCPTIPATSAQYPSNDDPAVNSLPHSSSRDLLPSCNAVDDRQEPPQFLQQQNAMVKAELVTPVLKTALTHPEFGVVDTPTTKRVKPEPLTLRRESRSALSSASTHAGQLPLQDNVKPEVSTPLIERFKQSTTSEGLNAKLAPRREQSLDYEPGPSHLQGTNPSAESSDVQAGFGAESRQIALPRPLPTALNHAVSASGTPSPAVSFGLSSSEFPPPPLASKNPIPDLAYPSRAETPALIVSTLPSGESPMGLGVFGSSRLAEPPTRGHTPPPVPQLSPMRGRPQRQDQKQPAANLHTPAVPARLLDHWSPTPGRPYPPVRRPLSPPSRHKRTRAEDDEQERFMPRPRRSPGPCEVPRAAEPLARGPNGPHPRSRSPYDDRRRPSPEYYQPRRDRSFSPRRSRSPAFRSPRRSRSRSPSSPPPYARQYSQGTSADGYAPPPQPPREADRHEADVRFPQVVAPAIPTAAAPVPVRAAAAPRGKSRAQGAAPATPARGPPPGRPAQSVEAEGQGKASLLARISVPSMGGEATLSKTLVKTPTGKATRGGGKPRGSARGRRGENGPSRGGHARGGRTTPLSARVSKDEHVPLSSRISEK